MRGPGLHISPDLRRLWRCPACGRERLVGQTETSVVCRCQDPPKFMQLVEGKRVVRPEPRPVPRFYEEEDLPPDEVDPNAPPIDPAVQMVTPEQKQPRPPRTPRPENERQGDSKGKHPQRPPRNGGGPQQRRGPGGGQQRPPQPPRSGQNQPPAPVASAPSPTVPGDSTAPSGDRPKKKRRRNRDRNREEGTGSAPQDAAPGQSQDISPPPAEDFGAGLE